MCNQFFVHSRVYSDTFRNKPYSMSMFEDVEWTTPELIDYESNYYEMVMERRRARVEREKLTKVNEKSR